MTIKDLENEVNLFKHTTLRSQSIAQYFFIARTRQDLIDVYKLSLQEELGFLILGGGSNVAVLSNYMKGIVVKNLYIDKKIIKENNEEVLYQISSGYPTNKLVIETVNEGLEGIEYHLGLPGSIGGAVYMNSKWTNPLDYIGNHLVKAYLLTKTGDIKEVNKEYFNFEYDYSILQDTKELLLEAIFKFRKSEKEVLLKRSSEALDYRKKTQPMGAFTSGCFFRNISDQEKINKNLNTNSAGYLIDKSGLKGTKIGGFIVSKDHANFIINDGSGKPEDLVKLLKMIKDKVRQKFHIDLKEEVVLIN